MSASLRLISAGFSPLWVTLDENSEHAKAAAKIDIGERIADHDACCGGNLRKLSHGLLEEAWQRLAAVALPLVVGAEVETVHMSAVMCQQLLQSGVNGVNIRRRIEPQRNATLVGDDNYSHSCAMRRPTASAAPGSR